MDVFVAVGDQAGCKPWICYSYGTLCMASFASLIISFTVYMGIYAFNNPNPPCWYSDAGLTAADPGVTAEFPNAAQPIHDQFVTWFLWGFINQLVWLALPLCWCSTGWMPGECKFHFWSTSVGVCASSTAWWVAGMCWRYGVAGQYASGDALEA